MSETNTEPSPRARSSGPVTIGGLARASAKRKEIRSVANSRLKNIREKMQDLERMERVLAQLAHYCERANSLNPCPIIAALSEG